MQSGHGNPFSEVAALSIAQARCAKNAEDDLEDTQIKLGPIPVGPEQTLKNRRPGKTRHGLFRLAHMNDGHENGQASVLFLFSPHRKALHVSINRSGRDSLSSHHLQRQRDLLRVDVRPRFVRPGLGRAEAGPCELPHRRLHHEDGSGLAPVGSLGLRIHRNLCGAGSGASSARPHRLRIPPAMGETELARASVSQRALESRSSFRRVRAAPGGRFPWLALHHSSDFRHSTAFTIHSVAASRR